MFLTLALTNRARWPRYLLAAGCFFISGCKPQDEGLTFDQALDRGWSSMQVGEFNQAETRFYTALEKSNGELNKKSEALYALGMNFSLRRPGEDFNKANEYFDSVLSLQPKSDFAAWSLLAKARMLAFDSKSDAVDVSRLRQAYQNVIESFPAHPAADEAFLYLQLTYLKTLSAEDAKKAIVNLQEFIRTHPSSKYIGPAHFMTAEAYAILKEPRKRLEEMILGQETAEKNRFTQVDSGPTYIRIGNIALYDVGNLEVAEKYFKQYLADNPSERRRFIAEDGLKRIEQIRALQKSRSPLTAQLSK